MPRVPPLPPEAQRLWNGLFQLDGLFNDAVTRLRQVADGEKVLGYEESAARYYAAADEVREARIWAGTEIRKLIAGIERGQE